MTRQTPPHARVAVQILERSYGHNMREWEASRLADDLAGSPAPRALLDGLDSLAQYIAAVDQTLVTSGGGAPRTKRDNLASAVETAWELSGSLSYEAAIQQLEWVVECCNGDNSDVVDYFSDSPERTQIEDTANLLIQDLTNQL